MDKKWTKFLTILVLAILASQVNSAAINYEDAEDTEPATTVDYGSVPAATVDFGTALKMFFSAFQRLMPCGYPPLKIPVLAPFTIDFYSFNMTNGYYKAVGNLSNLMMTGLNKFEFLGFSYNNITNRTTFDLFYPEIQLLADSKMDAMAYVAGYPLNMADSGFLDIKVTDFRMVGDFILSPSTVDPGSLEVSDFVLHFYIGDAIFNNWNQLWDISGNNFANKFAGEFTKMWVQQIQAQVEEIYSQLLLPIINGRLSGVSMTDLIDFFVEESIEFNMANCTL
ncbi:uncharacterized protein [Musca autumnalis]|uniref:uncharacterized protein n=1 Tax=Musca autumnalis TaxID=221902 RepID=UPI003CF264E3